MFEDRPYLIHTNRELGLMLKGKKPLAMFTDAEGYWPEVLLRYVRMFDKHVASGLLVRRDHFIYPNATDKYNWHTVYFAVTGEEWRIDAMIALRSDKTWSDTHERREGELLGYEDWMNDYHLAARANS